MSKQQTSVKTSNDDHSQKSFGFVLIVIGTYLLLVNMGYLEWISLAQIISLWPLLLVYWGLQLLIENKVFWKIVTIVFGLLVAGYFFAAVAVSRFDYISDWFVHQPLGDVGGWWRQTNRDNYQQQQSSFAVADNQLNDVESRAITLNFDLGKAELTDTDNNQVFNLSADYYRRFGQPLAQSQIKNGKLNISVDTKQQQQPWIEWPNFEQRPFYRVVYGQPNLVTDLQLNVGLGSVMVDLNYVQHQMITIETGMGSTVLRLGSRTLPSQLQLKSGMGSIKVQLPPNVNVAVNHNIGIGTLEVDNVSLKGEGTYSPDQKNINQPQLVIDAEVGVGSIEISRD